MDFKKFISEAEEREAQISEPEATINQIFDRLEYLVDEIELQRDISNEVERSICPVGNGFEIIKSRSSYEVTYRGTSVWSVGGNDLKHGIFGGKTVPTDCSDNFNTSQMFGITVGWKRDMLLAFGIVWDGDNSGLQVLHWYPRDGKFNPLTVHRENQLLIRYGRKNDLRTRICWNTTRQNEFAFSPDQRTGKFDGCTKDGRPYGPHQYFVKLP